MHPSARRRQTSRLWVLLKGSADSAASAVCRQACPLRSWRPTCASLMRRLLPTAWSSLTTSVLKTRLATHYHLNSAQSKTLRQLSQLDQAMTPNRALPWRRWGLSAGNPQLHGLHSPVVLRCAWSCPLEQLSFCWYAGEEWAKMQRLRLPARARRKILKCIGHQRPQQRYLQLSEQQPRCPRLEQQQQRQRQCSMRFPT